MLTLPWPNQELRIDVTHDREEALRRLQESCDATHEFMTSVHLAGADEPMTAPTRVMATALCEHVETNYDVACFCRGNEFEKLSLELGLRLRDLRTFLA